MIPKPSQLATQAQTKLQTLVTLTRAGIVHPERPDHLWHTGARAAALRHHARRGLHRRPRKNFPDEPAIIDELGTLTFKQVDERTNALAHALARRRDRARATASRSCAATTAAGSTPCSPAPSSAPTRCS